MNDLDKFLIGVVLGITVGTCTTVVYKNEQIRRFKESAIKAGAAFYKVDQQTGVSRFYWNALPPMITNE